MGKTSLNKISKNDFNHSSFFDENEFNDLSNYVDDGKKKWF